MGLEVPNDSIYLWMYIQGLKHVSYDDVEKAVLDAGKNIRKKDCQNYWNGFYRSDLYSGNPETSMFNVHVNNEATYRMTKYSEYPEHPYKGMPEIENRWVPCNQNNKPMIKWGNGCLTRQEAKSWIGSKYLAENTKGTQHIIVDCDGDHDEGRLDMETIEFLSKYMHMTHTLYKPKMCLEYGYGDISGLPASYHLTFFTDRVIPTMHFPAAHIDIIGNKENSLRYIKNKVWNNVDMIPMTDEIWDDIKTYIIRREGSK